jgi:AAA family ATP:ADP antiporter
MSSPEAQRLSESLGGDSKSLSWNNMNMTSKNAGPSGKALKESDEEGHASLTNSTKKSAAGDIYADLDKPDEDDNDEDDFLDVPLSELRGSPFEKLLTRTLRSAKKLYTRLYGESLPPSEMLRTLCLAMTLFFMIGGYWLLRSLKDPILTALCGVDAIPKAKMVSVFVVLGVVSIYNRLLDSDIPRHHLFYVFGTFYFVTFTIISFLLMHPTIGMANEKADPGRIIGWISYCAIESFGSVMVSLFWSFANSNFSLETAKASYGVMVAFAQIGSILGPTVVSQYTTKVGVANIYLVGALCMLLLQCTMYMYIQNYGSREADALREEAASGAPKKAKPKAGILEGLQLFWNYNYVKGIFAISCLFMVEVTIVDFTMKVLARDYFANLHPCQVGMSCYTTEEGAIHGMSEDATAGFTMFMGLFGQATNTLSLILSLFGTSAVIRYLGLRLTLLLFPTLCLTVIICVRIKPTLYVVFAAMMTLKACSYALNNPTKEMLYQPTSPAVKYKAKSWIDIFGARGSKALGSVVTNAFSDSASNLVANGSLVGMAVASFLIWNANFMGKKFDEYTESEYIVGEAEGLAQHEVIMDSEEKQIEMAQVQNEENQDTSCAVGYEDDEEIGPEEEGQADESGESDDEDGGDEDDKEKAQVTMV